MGKLFIVILISAFYIQESQAISERLKFKVFSSGPDIYACNAGLSGNQTNHRICYFEGTKTSCTPTDCSTSSGTCDTSCQCTSQNGGEWLMNFGRADYQDWKDHGDHSVSGLVRNKVFRFSGGTNYAQLLNDDEAWNKRISNLSFELGSELYSARYFVDICYRGSQIEYYLNNASAAFNLIAQVYATDFLSEGPNSGDNNRDGISIPGTVDGQKYTELSSLRVQSYVTCDLQGVGSYKYAHNGTSAASGSYNTSINEAQFLMGSNWAPLGASEGIGSFMMSSPANVTASATNLINQYIGGGTSWYSSPNTPRFCKVRYIFTETNSETSEPNLRKWQRHGAEMCTYTEINEAANIKKKVIVPESNKEGL